MLNILFICAKNRLRSPTAEHLFADRPGVRTASAGVNHDADEPVSAEWLEWAELIVVMEATHRRKLVARHAASLKAKRVVCLDIPDHFDYMAPALVALLEQRMAAYLP
jgi:predicted protein tyrosine phosphatase